jgi:hypothetical protein
MYIEDLNDVSTIAKAMNLKKTREDFNKSITKFNTLLLEFIQYNFSDNVELKDSVASNYFNIVVTNFYWSDYKQEKLDQLAEQLENYVSSCTITPIDIPENNDDVKYVFRLKVIHD